MFLKLTLWGYGLQSPLNLASIHHMDIFHFRNHSNIFVLCMLMIPCRFDDDNNNNNNNNTNNNNNNNNNSNDNIR